MLHGAVKVKKFSRAALIDAMEPRVLLSGGPLNVPVFNSNPDGRATLFLDFDGAAAQTWETYDVPATPAFDTDGDPTTFSAGELSAISEICSRVAEKYSPFSINVTTVDPGTYDNLGAAAVVIGGDGKWSGGLYGGISYVGGFSNAEPNIGWVFSANLGGSSKDVAEASAHEAGHMFGLQHQSTYDETGAKTAEYYAGDNLKAPIMGNSYYAERGLWWSGHPSTSSTATQDDVSIISGGQNGFGYRLDEAGAALNNAATLGVNGNNYSASGVITRVNDVDLYKFTVASNGTVSFNLDVAPFGPMLDAKLFLKNSSNQVILTADTASLGESLSMALTPGTYYVGAASHGGVGDIGQYTLTGSFASGALSAPADPTNLAASVVSPTDVHLTWSDQSSNETSFRIESSTDGTNWTILGSVGANVTVYDDNSALPGTSYQYRVSAFADTAHSGFAISPTVKTWGGGTGLRADYFNNADFTGNTIAQTDPAINFNWQSGSPVTGIDPGSFSVRWTGQVQPLETGTYTFSTTADDGVRLWVNGQLLIDRWSDVKLAGDANGDGVVDSADFAAMYQHMGQAGGVSEGDFNGDGVVDFKDFQIIELSFGNSAAAITDSNTIALQAGSKYDIKLEYYQRSGAASVKLEWTTPSGTKQVVPQSQLFAPAAAPIPGAPISGTSTPSMIPYGDPVDEIDSPTPVVSPLAPKLKAAPKKVSKPIFSVTPVKVKVKSLAKSKSGH